MAEFRARLRIFLAQPLHTRHVSLTTTLMGNQVTFVSQISNQSLSETKWLVLSASGFNTEEAARDYGEKLRMITEIAGLCSRLGIDVGEDKATSWVNEEWARSTGIIQPHERIFPNVHGLVIVPDDGTVHFPIIDAKGSALFAPEQLLATMAEVSEELPIKLSAAARGMRVLNLALINNQPIAKIALALSVVESLGQDEKWSGRQVALIDELAAQSEHHPDYGEGERMEVADALRRSLHKVGLRQGVKRVLSSVSAEHLLSEWDRVYSLRCGLFHGTRSLSESEIATLANDALTLCGSIILTLAEREGLKLPAITSVHFPNRQS